MIPAIITIHAPTYDGSDQTHYHIGTVQSDNVTDDIDSVITRYWEEWNDEVAMPDSDSEFIDWLIAKNVGFVEPTSAVINVKIPE
jgi:hypothetical protein